VLDSHRNSIYQEKGGLVSGDVAGGGAGGGGMGEKGERDVGAMGWG